MLLCSHFIGKNVTLQASNRELIRLCYDINYISDDEFLLPYTGYELQNLELPYDSRILVTTNVWHSLGFKKCT